MGSYTLCDFSESMKCESITPNKIKSVVAAWGNVNKDGACCDACGGEWAGGFLLQLVGGGYAYLSGWCDYTGWGCQDGSFIEHYDTKPNLEDLEKFTIDKWDMNPSDLNKWLSDGAKNDKVY